jgi:di/tricarboxylate transporter
MGLGIFGRGYYNDLMSLSLLFTLAITLLATLLLIGNWLRPDLVALAVMVVLGVSGLVSPEAALAGFSGSAVVTILAVSIIAEGLRETGVAYRLGQQMKRLAGGGEIRVIVVVMLAGATLSLFMNNIAAMAVLLPATLALSRQTHRSPARLMMPLAFGVIVGGMATLFTTSNIIASSALREAGLKPFGVLDFLPAGLPLVVLAVLYMLLIGRRLLPKQEAGLENKQTTRNREDLLAAYRIKESLWAVTVLPGSVMSGLTISQGGWRTQVRLNVLSILRGSKYIPAPLSNTFLLDGDLVITQGEPDRDMLEKLGLRLEPEQPSRFESSGQEDSVAEIVLVPHSSLEGKSLRELHLREKTGLTVLALWRSGHPLHIGFASLPLRVGDALLVQGTVARLRLLHQERDFIILDEDPEAIARPRRATLAMLIGLGTLAVAVTGWLPISLVSLAGALAIVLTGCLAADQAYASIDWKSIFLIAGMWPLSTAIQNSGLSNALVKGLLGMAGHAGLILLVAVLLLVTMLLTNILAGQAAAPIILAPIGLSLARATGADPRMLLMAIALGCSLAFLTPIGHPVNAIAMSSGNYTFKDFLRVGWPLTALVFLGILLGLHFFWGL